MANTLNIGISRRGLLGGAAALAALQRSALAQQVGSIDSQPTTLRKTGFSFDDVISRAEELSSRPFAPANPAAGGVSDLSYDDYRRIQFRREKAFLSEAGDFRLHLFHLGYLFKTPVTINIQRGGTFAPIPYAHNLFQFGEAKPAGRSDPNMGFAGFKLTYPLNEPGKDDEVASFLGASYFRVLARGQRYGISARALAVSTIGGGPEEFPAFREFWVFQPKAKEASIRIFALLDSISTTGACEFLIRPGEATAVETRLVLFPRVTLGNIGIAPFSSMYFFGENDRKPVSDFRPEVHDSDGLQVQQADGEWLWHPLKRVASARTRSLPSKDVRGFGLFQRDRSFEHYQDLEAVYQRRPSYWVIPDAPFGEGSVELLELPTADETHDNIVAFWRPSKSFPPRAPVRFSYTLFSTSNTPHQLAKVVNTFEEGSNAGHAAQAGARRVLIDFDGLPPGKRPEIEIDSGSASLVDVRLLPNAETGGLRAMLDCRMGGGTTDVSVYLQIEGQRASETWRYALEA